MLGSGEGVRGEGGVLRGGVLGEGGMVGEGGELEECLGGVVGMTALKTISVI